MSADMEAHLDRVFSEAAASRAKDMAGKIYSYQLDPLGYTVQKDQDKKSGKCMVTGVHYSSKLDCNVYHLQELITNEEFSVCEFEISLKEIGT